MQQLSAESSEDAGYSISHEKGSLQKLCLWSWGIHSSKLSLIKGFTFAEAYAKSNQYTRIPQKSTRVEWGWKGGVILFSGWCVMHSGLQLLFIYIPTAWSCDSYPWEWSSLSSLVCARSFLWQPLRETASAYASCCSLVTGRLCLGRLQS